MSDSSSKPSVLIFGGLNTCSRALAAFLVPVDAEPLVSRIRIVDKYSVTPPTTYIGPEFTQVLQSPFVEYKQANLTNKTAINAAFEPTDPSHSPFDYVFDFTGEVRNDRNEVIQISTTFGTAKLLGQEAASRNVKAYVRISQPFYQTSGKQPATEKDDIKPSETLGIWWHETQRLLGSIEGLNLVILRVGFMYGPYTNFGNIASAITVSSVYGYMQKPMRSMWAPGKNPTNTVHVEDVSGAAWACANWIAARGRKAADEAAGEVIHFHNEKNKIKEVDGMRPHTEKIVAPVFNIVDESNSTLVSTGTTIASVFSTSFEFFSLMESTVIKVLDDLEDINEHHVESWTEMLLNSTPPINQTPLTAYMDKYTLDKHNVSFDNLKIKQLIGYKLKRPEFSKANIQEVVDKWKAEGIFPNAVPNS